MPAYNAERYLPLVLPPLVEMLKAGEIVEILLVDDQSTDATAALARSFGARVLTNPQRGGPGAARNFAARQAKGDILWLVDADVIAHPGGAAQIKAAMADPTVHAVFGSYDDAPAGQSWISKYKNLMHRFYHQGAAREASTFWAGCGALRKSAFLAVGGFDTVTYKMPSIEDIELGYRMREKGGRILLLPDLLGKHLKVWTVSSAIHTDIFKRAIPWSRLMIQSGSITNDLNTSMDERIKAGIAGLFLVSLPLLVTGLWVAPLALFIVALALNLRMVDFLAKRGGLIFAMAGFLFHQIYYVYSASAFVWCLLEAKLGRRPQNVPKVS